MAHSAGPGSGLAEPDDLLVLGRERARAWLRKSVSSSIVCSDGQLRAHHRDEPAASHGLRSTPLRALSGGNSPASSLSQAPG
ncbi:hypothetical protein [Streptomyces sp. NPDC058644]|uniref:hypothetical protein n=1 Tax=unclassified Streptomyces TaxID=2593676 RepID=UPI003661FBFA